jgi:hypothetical protein
MHRECSPASACGQFLQPVNIHFSPCCRSRVGALDTCRRTMALEIGLRCTSNRGFQDGAFHWRSPVGSFAIRQDETAKQIEVEESVPGELALQVNSALTVEQIARKASMHKRVSTMAKNHKRTYIEFPPWRSIKRHWPFLLASFRRKARLIACSRRAFFQRE